MRQRFVIYLDAPECWQMTFQDPATPVMTGIIDLHHDIFALMIGILFFVLWMLSRTVLAFEQEKNPKPVKVIHGVVIETIWTLVPSFILILIALPSFALLYSIDELNKPQTTLKAIGNQWYWSYEYSDFFEFSDQSAISGDQSIVFDSYMIPEDDLSVGQFRLLEVDNRIVLPIKTHIRLIITASDVLHSFAVPSLGVKCDAVPGRLNQVSVFIEREGLFYGQCSELCGVNHGFMPIVVEAVPVADYIDWIINRYTELNE